MTRTTGGALAALTAVLAAALVTVAPLTTCDAQRTAPAARQSRWRPSIRADAILDRDPGAQFGIGLALASAYNVRLGLDAGAGGAQRPGGWTSAGRLDVLGRWLSDPFRQSRWGINAGGGIGERVEVGRKPTTVAIVTLGLEGPSDGAWVPGVEIGLGGGVRAGITFRRAPLRQR